MELAVKKGGTGWNYVQAFQVSKSAIRGTLACSYQLHAVNFFQAKFSSAIDRILFFYEQKIKSSRSQRLKI